MSLRATDALGVTFVDCDVGAMEFSGSVLRRARLEGCTFRRCSGPSHVRYHSIEFVACRWEDGEVHGSIRGARFEDCVFERMLLHDLELTRSRLERVRASDTRGTDVVLRETSFVDVEVTGEVRRLSLVDINAHGLDLSRLHVIDGGIMGLTGSRTELPDFPDSFVVRSSTIELLGPKLRGLVRAEAFPTLASALTPASSLEFMDSSRLRSLYRDDAPQLWPEEQDAVLAALWTERVRSAAHD